MNNNKNYLVIGADIPLLQTFRKAMAVRGSVIWIDIRMAGFWDALQEHTMRAADVWLFDADFGNNSHLILQAMHAALQRRPARICYIYGPGGNDLSGISIDIPADTAFRLMKQPDCVVDRAGGNLICAGVAEHLLRIKEEIGSKLPAFWEHNAFPLPAGGCAEPLTAVYLEELFERSAELPDKGGAKQAMRIGTAIPFTLLDLCRRIMGVEIQLFEGPPATRFAGLVNEVVQAFSYGAQEEYTGGAHLVSAITLDEVAGLMVGRSRAEDQTETPHRGGIFPHMKEKWLDAADGRSIRYFTGGSGTEVILIINALGLTIRFWERALQLLMRSFTVVVWETRCCELFSGGMEAVITIDEHVDDILDIIRHEQWTKCHLVSWCNGARIAVAAAARDQTFIASLIFLSPVFRGIDGVPADDTKFERELDDVFREVIKNNRIAGLFADYLIRSNSKTEDLGTSADLVLSLPDESFKKEVIAPMRTGSYLINYANRTNNDEHYPIRQLIGGITRPVMFILGSDDAVISNRLCGQVGSLFSDTSSYMVSGASHYIQLQQPSIFAALVSAFLQKREYAGDGVRVKKILHCS